MQQVYLFDNGYTSNPTDDWGWEYKSQVTVSNIPLVHISFKYRADGTPVVAKGIVAVGQFAVGVVDISQFGIGLFSLSQFTIAGIAVSQFAVAYTGLAQVALYLNEGLGQVAYSVSKLFGG